MGCIDRFNWREDHGDHVLHIDPTGENKLWQLKRFGTISMGKMEYGGKVMTWVADITYSGRKESFSHCNLAEIKEHMEFRAAGCFA